MTQATDTTHIGCHRGMTLAEVCVSMGIMSLMLAVTMQILVGTSKNMDVEMKESDLNKRVTGRMNDLMMMMRKEVESHIIRLAQKSR